MAQDTGFLSFFTSGGFVMYPLLLCSILSWVVIFERLVRYRKLNQQLKSFYLEAQNVLLRGDADAVKRLCAQHADLPSAHLLMVAMERLQSKDQRIKDKWRQAVERQRQLANLELKKGLWILGTIGSASPFIGLFGTVVGILRSFGEMAKTGAGGFAVVAAGISEALIATAAGIVVAVIAVMAYNAFQTRWSALVLMLKMQVEEFSEILSDSSWV